MLEVTDLLAIEDFKDKGNSYLYIIIVLNAFSNTVTTPCIVIYIYYSLYL